MPNRVLETVLTGRNLLSPMLATASRDVVTFNSTVATAQGKAATSAVTAAGVQDGAAAKIAASNLKASTSATVSAQTQAQAHARAAESATLSARVQQSANQALARSNGLLGTSLTPLTAGLGAVGLALGYAGFRGMEFDSAMSQVQAASQASAGDMAKMSDAAVKAGADTQYSAVEAAQGITEMSKAGVSARDILGGGLTGALNLAAAGQISVAEAAETGATALSVFGLKGDQMSHVADLLAAGAGKAQGSVGDLSQALNQSALVANQTGLSIEDTAGSLAMFASNGLVGSDAGTSFKAMLQALTPNSVAAANAMDAIGFSAYDAQGKFVGMESVAGQLRTGLAGLTEEQRNTTLETIFGSDAVRAASVLYSEGARGVEEWAGNVNDAGYAARQAAQLNDNLKGDLEKLGGAFDSLMTSIGGGVQGPLRLLTQGLTGLLNVGGDVLGFFTSLPGPVQAAVAAFAGWAVAGDSIKGMFGGLMEKLGPLKDELSGGWDAFQEALGHAKENGDGLTEVLGSVGEVGLESAKGGLKALASAVGPELGMAAAAYMVSRLVDNIVGLATAGDGAAQEIRSLNDEIDGADSNEIRFDTINTGLQTLKDQAADARATIAEIENMSYFRKVVISPFYGLDGSDLKDAQVSLERYNEEIDRLESANARAEESTDLLADKFHLTSEEVVELASKYGVDLTGSLSETNRLFENFYTQEFGTAPTDAANATGAAMVSAKQSTEEAAKAQEDYMADVADSMAGFVEPLAAYTGLLDEKTAADRAAAEETASATASSTDSWKDYVSDVTVSFEEYMTRLEEQLAAQENWQLNMLRLAGRVSQGTLDELARMGPEGAPLVAELVNRSDAELDRFDDVTAARSQQATDAWAQQLIQATPVLAAIGRMAGQGVVDELTAKLQAGTTTVALIAQQYGINLAGGINPILTALGKRPIAGQNGRVGGLTEADGGIVSYYANGGMENHVAQIAPGGAWRVWAEPETEGEAYIPLAASKRDRSMNIWRETGKRLGAPEAKYFADGGFASVADVPRPPSTAPYGPPISTAGDAAMDTQYVAATEFVRANGPWGRALEWAKSQVGKPYIWGGVGPAGYDCSGFMSAITNVLLGLSPHSRRGATANFPWPGFAPGMGEFTIGSTKDAGGGIGHMAGTLHGVNVESTGGVGVKVGGSARGASNGLFGTRAHLAMFGGGVIDEPVVGIGARSGNSYSFGERGPELVTPASMPGYGAAATGGSYGMGGGSVVVNMEGAQITGTLAFDADGLVHLVDGRVVKAWTIYNDRGRNNPR